MTLGAAAALVCIVVGFGLAIFDGEFLFPPQTWFVAAIPFALIGGPAVGLPGRKQAQ